MLAARIVAQCSPCAVNHDLADARLNLANEAERERRRIARDLHDQTLADLRHLLLLTDQLAAGGNSRDKPADAGVLRGEIENISQEVRRICEDLSPSVLQNVGFSAALEFALSHAVQDAPLERKFEYQFFCEDDLEERTKLPANVQMQIYRITQEAVSNLCRHAAPQHVKMEVSSSTTGAFILKLEDDGRDFDPAAVGKTDGRGLANMQARASLIDAKISWARRAGGGTVFTLERDMKNLRSGESICIGSGVSPQLRVSAKTKCASNARLNTFGGNVPIAKFALRAHCGRDARDRQKCFHGSQVMGKVLRRADLCKNATSQVGELPKEPATRK